MRFGAGHLIDILLGNMTDRVRERGHDALPTFAVGKEYDKRQWQAVFRQMNGHDLVRPDPERHGALRMTDAALPILRAEATIDLRRDTIKAAGKNRRPAAKAMVNEEDAPLLSALKAKRRALAEAARVPAYIIFTDKTLIEMAETRPTTLDGMARIGGIGAKKLESYGAGFLEVITGAGSVDPMHPTRRKLAGRDAGAIYDRLLEVQNELARGVRTGSTNRSAARPRCSRKWRNCGLVTRRGWSGCWVIGEPSDLAARFWTCWQRRTRSRTMNKGMMKCWW